MAAGLALVLEVIRLLVELLRRNHLPLLRERVMIISYYEVAGIKQFHGAFFCSLILRRASSRSSHPLHLSPTVGSPH